MKTSDKIEALRIKAKKLDRNSDNFQNELWKICCKMVDCKPVISKGVVK